MAFHCLSLAFRCLSLAFHCLSLAFHCLSLAFHCLSLAFRCLSLTSRCLQVAEESDARIAALEAEVGQLAGGWRDAVRAAPGRATSNSNAGV